MTTDKKAKRTLEDLIDECIEFVDSTMKEAVDDANELWCDILDEYRVDDRCVEVPPWKVPLMEAAINDAFRSPYQAYAGATERVVAQDHIGDDRWQLALVIDRHFSIWASASLKAKARIHETRREIINRLGSTDLGKMCGHLAHLEDALNVAEQHLGRLAEVTPVSGYAPNHPEISGG